MDVKDIICRADSFEQFQTLVKEAGLQLSRAETEKVFLQYTKGRELSEDEIAAVSGSSATKRDYATQGCAATVSYGSDCWGTDGGCLAINIDYDHQPLPVICPECRSVTVYLSSQSNGVNHYRCHSCGAAFDKPQLTDSWSEFI